MTDSLIHPTTLNSIRKRFNARKKDKSRDLTFWVESTAIKQGLTPGQLLTLIKNG